MARIVLKFGGTSVGDTDRIKHAARKVKARQASREWVDANRESERARWRKVAARRRKENRAETLAANRAWYAANREKVLAQKREAYKAAQTVSKRR